MVKAVYVLIKANHINEILYSLSHHRENIVALFGGDKQKEFINNINANTNYTKITPYTFDQFVTPKVALAPSSTVILMNAPNTFEILNEILTKAKNNEIILVLLNQNKKYVNMISKKIEQIQELKQLEYSENKFVGINDKIRDLVDQSYDMNRAGFFAYGEYINYFRANLLKKIFITQLINVNDLGRSYGFASAPRVKQGSFLSAQARRKKNQDKKARRQQRKQTQKNMVQNQQVVKKPKKINNKQKKIKKSKVTKSLISK